MNWYVNQLKCVTLTLLMCQTFARSCIFIGQICCFSLSFMTVNDECFGFGLVWGGGLALALANQDDSDSMIDQSTMKIKDNRKDIVTSRPNFDWFSNNTGSYFSHNAMHSNATRPVCNRSFSVIRVILNCVKQVERSFNLQSSSPSCSCIFISRWSQLELQKWLD